MDINPDNLALIQHQEWLHNPVTISMLNILNMQRETFVQTLSKQAGKADVDDSQIRRTAYGISVIDVINTWITDTNIFVEKQKQATSN